MIGIHLVVVSGRWAGLENPIQSIRELFDMLLTANKLMTESIKSGLQLFNIFTYLDMRMFGQQLA